MNSLHEFTEIDLSQRILLLSQSCCTAARYPGVQISQRRDTPWTYDIHTFWPEFDREAVPLEQLLTKVEDVVTTLMAYHPEMLPASNKQEDTQKKPQ